MMAVNLILCVISIIPNLHSFIFSAEVKMPSGHIDEPTIEDNRDGTVSIKYEPREEGIHELFVKYNGEHVQGKALLFKR